MRSTNFFPMVAIYLLLHIEQANDSRARWLSERKRVVSRGFLGGARWLPAYYPYRMETGSSFARPLAFGCDFDAPGFRTLGTFTTFFLAAPALAFAARYCIAS